MVKRKLRFNPKSKDFLRDPYPTYEDMRQLSPAYKVANTLILTRYEDVFSALRNPALGSSGIPESLLSEYKKHLLPLSQEQSKIISHILLFEDGVHHREHRKSLMQLLSGDNLIKFSELIESEVSKLMLEVRKKNSFDVIHSIAHPLWFNVFIGWLKLDRSDIHILYHQSENIRLLLDPSAITRDGLLHLIEAIDTLSQLFQKNYANNKASDTPSLFFNAVTAGNTHYSAMDYTIDAITAFIGGGETTGALIGNTVYFLSTLPNAQNAARQNAAVIRNLIQETMRLESPLQMTRRRVNRPINILNVELKVGDNVLLCLGAANRDDALFTDPNTFLMDRKNGGKQLGFGVGIHQCLGQLLAQRQAEIVCHSLLENFAELHYDGELPPQWQDNSLILRALSCLPVTVSTTDR